MNDKITIADLYKYKAEGRKIAAVSCYDCITANLCEKSGIEMLLVGDSAAQVVLGHKSTLPVTMDFMVELTAGVRRGSENTFLVADMPFLSYQTGIGEAIKNAGRFVAGAGADMVKIEAASEYLDVIKQVSSAGISVMAHIGVKPQYIGKTGKYKAEGRGVQQGLELVSMAEQMVSAGAKAILVEASASEVGEMITERVDVPVISCGGGDGCDGQILVAPDILGLTEGKTPKFVKKYADLAKEYRKAFTRYAEEVRDGKFPDDEHSYHMKKGEFEQLKKQLRRE
jgi:3-methyl-2-oxobutanoate hydroxymethyltransferase